MNRCAAALALLLLAAASCRQDAPPPARQTFDPGPVPAALQGGEQLYEARCSACHGEHGIGTDRGPPLVHPVYRPSHHADEAFQRAVAFGVQAHHWDFGPMQPVPGVGRHGVAQVVAYVRWLQRQGGIF